jgi:very-short-patch-repair endonuclease
MLALIRSTPGLPLPEVQAWIDFGDGEPMIRADFAWRGARVILETDGAIHRRGRRVERDARRDQRAARAGWMTLRFSSDQIATEPARLRATLLDIVRSRSGPLPIAA